MSLSLDIVPSSDSLNMYGSEDPSSAYSLSGHVSISLTSPFSIFEPRRAANMLLQSLQITFEGQSELICPNTGYTPIRLCSMSHELVPGKPVEISNRGHEDSDEPCTWNVVFNIPIPGWLPETCHFGYFEDVGTVYTLIATAKFTNLESPSIECSFATLCSSFLPKVKYVTAQKSITVTRFVNPPAVSSSSKSLFPAMMYGVDARPGGSRTCDSSHIPADVLSNIEVLVSVPEYISLDEGSVPFTIRLRSTDLDSAECKRLQVTEFSVKLLQIEKYTPSPESEYSMQYLLPSGSSQPPNKPLLRPSAISAVYDMVLDLPSSSPTDASSRQFSIVPTNESGIYVLSGDTYIFAPDVPGTPPTWFTMETGIPFVRQQISKRRQRAEELMLRPTAVSPLFKVRHEMRISLTCSYDMPGCERKVVECLHLSLPLRFVRVTPSPTIPPSSAACPTPLLANDMFTTTAPCPLSLPAYSQLFDYNGDRRIDHSVQLPPYSPLPTASSSSSSSSTLELEAGGKTKMTL